MAKEWAIPFYNSKQWKRCRAGFIRERIRADGGMCQVCQEKLGYIVHHKIVLTPENITNPDISLNWDYLSYECKDCHDKNEGHRVGVASECVCEFDENGDPIAIKQQFLHDRL